MKKAMTIAMLFAMALPAAPASALPLNELVRKADRVLRGKSSAGVFSMTVKTKTYQRDYTVVMWDETGKTERTLIKILGPALWRGHGTLKVGDQLKLYNPRSNHVTVVGTSMLGNSWMGSHFTNDDLVKETRLDRHFNKKLVKSWEAKTEDGKPATFHRIDLTPRPTAPVAWGKITYTLWERDGLVIPTEARYYRKASDKDQKRTLTFSQVQEMGGRTVPAKMTMTVADKPGEFTSVVYKNLKFNVKIPDRKFTEQALKH